MVQDSKPFRDRLMTQEAEPTPQRDAGRSRLMSQLRAAQGKVQNVSRAALKCGRYVTQSCRALAASSFARGSVKCLYVTRAHLSTGRMGGPGQAPGPENSLLVGPVFESHRDTGSECREIQGLLRSTVCCPFSSI